MVAMTNSWHKASWRDFPIKQQPNYDNSEGLKRVEEELSHYPPLVYFDEIRKLKQRLSMVCDGKAFLLQGGDCAESFAEFNEENLRDYFKVILQMTAVLMHGSGKHVVKVGRIAGQFAKPRSADFEEINGEKIFSYRGDMVNSIDASHNARKPDPQNLLRAYQQSGATLNFLRALAAGGFASLHNVNEWISDFVNQTPENKKVSDIVEAIKQATVFFEACGVDLNNNMHFNSADFFTSHEGLILPYEESLMRYDLNDNKNYCCSAHMLWIGDRTRNIDESHIEFMRGIANPIAMKIGPSITPSELIEIIDILNPNNEPGKLTLISRMGKDKVEESLSPLIDIVQQNNKQVIWSCDPMHGNTEKSSNGFKTRKFDNILSEVRKFFQVHKKMGSYAGGIHIEMTGQNVTECLGGTQDITEINLKDRYHTHCDPRLNGNQSLELAFLIAEEMRLNKSR